MDEVATIIQRIAEQISRIWARIGQLDDLIEEVVKKITNQTEAYEEMTTERERVRSELAQLQSTTRGYVESFSSRTLQRGLEEILSGGEQVFAEQDDDAGKVLSDCQREMDENDQKKRDYQTERTNLGDEITRLNAQMSLYEGG